MRMIQSTCTGASVKRVWGCAYLYYFILTLIHHTRRFYSLFYSTSAFHSAVRALNLGDSEITRLRPAKVLSAFFKTLFYGVVQLLLQTMRCTSCLWLSKLSTSFGWGTIRGQETRHKSGRPKEIIPCRPWIPSSLRTMGLPATRFAVTPSTSGSEIW